MNAIRTCGKLLLVLLVLLPGMLCATVYEPDSIDIFTDTARVFTIEQALSGDLNQRFQHSKNNRSTKNEAYNYFLRVQLKNDNRHAVIKHVVFQNAFYSKISFVYLDKEGHEVYQYAGLSNYGTEYSKSAIPYFQVSLPAQSSCTAYAFIEGHGIVNRFHVQIKDDFEYTRDTEQMLLLNGAFYGMLMLLVLINVFYSIAMRRLVFAAYALSVSATIFMYSFLDNIPLLGAAPFMGDWHGPLLVSSVIVQYSYFPFMVFIYLGLKRKDHPRLTLWLAIFGGISIIAILAPFIYHTDEALSFYYFYYNFICLASVPFNIIIGLRGRKIDKQLSRSFLVAYSLLFVFTLISFLESDGVTNLGLGYLTLKIGTILEVTIMSFALAMRFRRVEMEYRTVQYQQIYLKDRFFRAQINPHFIFNVLGSINGYIQDNKPDQASTYLLRFSHLIRGVLRSTEEDNILLREELEMITSYVDLEKMRAHYSFDFVLDVDASINSDHVRIPAMLIQPFIENAIKHGVSSCPDSGLIQLVLRLENQLLSIKVIDNGKGVDLNPSEKSESLHMGMKNVTNRIAILEKKFGINVEMSVRRQQEPEQGTVVHIKVPVIVLSDQ